MKFYYQTWVLHAEGNLIPKILLIQNHSDKMGKDIQGELQLENVISFIIYSIKSNLDYAKE